MNARSRADADLYADPYLAWSTLAEFKGHAAVVSDNAPIPLLIRADDKQRKALAGKLRIAGAWPPGAAYFTATADREVLKDVQPLVQSMEFALPLAAGPLSEEAPELPEAQAPFVLAVIDRGCAFLNANFCEGAPALARRRDHVRKSRLIALWDQGRSARARGAEADAGPWTSPKGFGYGRELDAEAIRRQFGRLGAPAYETEAAIYKDLDYLLDNFGRLRDNAHGTHVLDTAGGSIDTNPPRSSAKPAHEDAAARAPLIFVDVPALAPGDTTGASPGVFLLDALRYIRLRAGEGAQVVVNISLGAFAGPHDGTSMTEQAIDDFIANDGLMLVTVAAGNAANERWHASGDLAGDAGAELCWRTMPEDPTDSFLEVWFDAAETDAHGEVAIQVTPPRGQPTGWLTVADGLCEIDDGESRLGAVIGRRPRVDDNRGKRAPKAQRGKSSRSDGMFLIALGPTAGERRMAPPGLWRIALRNTNAGIATRFDAWIQRDEPAWSAGPSVQSFFESASPGVRVGGDAGGLSSLATGKETIVVGAASAEDGRAARYSSRGGRPRRGGGGARRDVDAVADADESQTAVGLLAAGVPSFTLVRMGGTSVAAPAAARLIYDALVKRDAKPAPGERTLPRPGPGSAPRRARLAEVRKALRDPEGPKTPEPRFGKDRRRIARLVRAHPLSL